MLYVLLIIGTFHTHLHIYALSLCNTCHDAKNAPSRAKTRLSRNDLSNAMHIEQLDYKLAD